MMQTEPPQFSSSPSFSSYSSETLAQIAARVIEELRRDPHSLSLHDDGGDTLFDSWENDNVVSQGNDDPNENDDDDFEFAFVSRASPVSADDIFYNGQIRPTYPLFDRNLLNGVASVLPVPSEKEAVVARRRRLPLRKLMFEERETASCTSSASEAGDSNNELNGVAAGTYCVWTPKTASCKKSNSTGSSSSKRWKLRELLLRSHSDRKEPKLFLGPTKRADEGAHDVVPKPSTAADDGAAAAVAGKEGNQSKRKSFLPYRHELVGFFSNVNGVGRNLQPF